MSIEHANSVVFFFQIKIHIDVDRSHSIQIVVNALSSDSNSMLQCVYTVHCTSVVDIGGDSRGIFCSFLK